MVVNIRVMLSMKVSVVSGKGGTGKTTVATSLALSIENSQLIDADVEEPNCFIFLNTDTGVVGQTEILVPKIDEEICTQCGKCSDSCEYNALAKLPGHILLFEKICHGCGVCSAVCPEGAITEEPRAIGYIYSSKDEDLLFNYGELIVGEELSTPIISKLKEYTDDEKNLNVIDSPPGSACAMVEAVIDSDFVIVVGEPTPFGLSDMKIVIETLRQLEKKFGIVINKDGVGDNEMERYCLEEDLPILMKIPFDINIAKNYSVGKTLVESFPEWKEKFTELRIKIEEMV